MATNFGVTPKKTDGPCCVPPSMEERYPCVYMRDEHASLLLKAIKAKSVTVDDEIEATCVFRVKRVDKSKTDHTIELELHSIGKGGVSGQIVQGPDEDEDEEVKEGDGGESDSGKIAAAQSKY